MESIEVLLGRIEKFRLIPEVFEIHVASAQDDLASVLDDGAPDNTIELTERRCEGTLLFVLDSLNQAA